MSKKPVVRYLRSEDNKGYHLTQHFGIEGSEFLVAIIYDALDHPRFGRSHLRTSTVLKESPDGRLETRNTIYVPVYSYEEKVPKP